ncbi:hypothetical protein QQ045_032135 [Rhodiola kirilowii]
MKKFFTFIYNTFIQIIHVTRRCGIQDGNSEHLHVSCFIISTKLVVSEDGKKIKRQHPFTEADLEELQSRIVIAENIPEDHCYQLMKLFSVIGNVKTIRTCQPQPNNGGSSSAKADSMHISNMLHAFVEYETAELAEKAVSELNWGKMEEWPESEVLPQEFVKTCTLTSEKGELGGRAH